MSSSQMVDPWVAQQSLLFHLSQTVKETESNGGSKE